MVHVYLEKRNFTFQFFRDFDSVDLQLAEGLHGRNTITDFSVDVDLS
jgi:hypothetical protein